MRKTPTERFFKHTEKTETCWVWKKYINKDGYGQFGVNGTIIGAHRFSYEIHKGKIPSGLDIDHLCRVRHCVNPDHLEAVTHEENIRRSKNFNQSHCKRGHEFTESNTYRMKSGGRQCRKCIQEKRGVKKQRFRLDYETHCANGHEKNSKTLFIVKGTHLCRICQRKAAMKSYFKSRHVTNQGK